MRADGDEDDDIDEALEAGGPPNESSEERKAARKGFFPSSMGLGFFVAAGVDALTVPERTLRPAAHAVAPAHPVAGDALRRSRELHPGAHLRRARSGRRALRRPPLHGNLRRRGHARRSRTAGPHIEDHFADALRAGALCSNDPICAHHTPAGSMESRWLHGAACHGCTLLSETSCEMRNDYLDRALVMPVLGLEDAAFFPRTG